MQESPVLRLKLFGFWRLTRGQEIISVPSRSRRLLAFLALHGRQARPMVAGALWPDVDERRAQTSLRAALSMLHRHIPAIVQADDGEIELDNHVAVDVQEFQANARYVLSGRLPELPGSIDHPTLIGGELLPGWYDDWVLAERERIRQTRLYVLEALAVRLIEHGARAQALEAALKAVEIDPLRESARRSVIHVHLAEGNAAAAVREYEQFRTMLFDELHVEPTRHITDLIEQVTQPH